VAARVVEKGWILESQAAVLMGCCPASVLKWAVKHEVRVATTKPGPGARGRPCKGGQLMFNKSDCERVGRECAACARGEGQVRVVPKAS
jgi:hypothetical protein